MQQIVKKVMFSESCHTVSPDGVAMWALEHKEAIYFRRSRELVEARLVQDGWNIVPVNHIMYLGVISDRKFI
jgi:hypothetical protein